MTFSEYLNYFRDAVRTFSNQNINFSKHSIMYSIGAAVASLSAKINAIIDNVESRTSILSASGSDLDNLLANFKIARKIQSFSTGELNIWRNTLPATPAVFPSGTSYTDANGNTYLTTEMCVIPTSTSYYPTDMLGAIGARYYALPLASGYTSYTETDSSVTEIRQQLRSTIGILAQSSSAGIEYNAPADTITTSSSASVYVNNPEPFQGGADVEDDESFRGRGLNLIRGANSKFVANSLEAFVKSQQGVLDAKVIEDCGCLTFAPPQNGSIYVIVNTTLSPVESGESSIPEEDPRNIYEKIRKAIETEETRPAAIGVTVKEAEIFNVDFLSDAGNYMTIYVKDNVVPSIKKVELRESIYNYFLRLKIGDSVYDSDIINLLKNDTDVIDIDAFTFKQISGVNDAGSDIYEDVETLTAVANQVFRIKSPKSISLMVVHI